MKKSAALLGLPFNPRGRGNDISTETDLTVARIVVGVADGWGSFAVKGSSTQPVNNIVVMMLGSEVVSRESFMIFFGLDCYWDM